MAKKTRKIVPFAEFRRRKLDAEATARAKSRSSTKPAATARGEGRSSNRESARTRDENPASGEAAPSPAAAAAIAANGPSASMERLLQSGVLAYRRAKDGELLVLLVTKKRSKQWGIPKGKVEPHLSFGENAAKEAFEEAGVRGRISPNSAGMFRATKRSSHRLSAQIIEVWVYFLEVTECLSRWPEKGKRQTKWVPCDAAAAALREPVLVDLCRRLAQG